MKALITGAGGGIGKQLAICLKEKGYELILIARDKEESERIKKDFKKAKVLICDLANQKEVFDLYEKTKNEEIDLLVNNAGFGLLGLFNNVSLEKELAMVDVNIKAVHILTKLFLADMIKKDHGRILNTASIAGFMGGPYQSTYFATKNYVLKLTLAIDYELRRQKSKVKVCALCPGTVATGFNKAAGGHPDKHAMTPEAVSSYAIEQMLKNKVIIIPSLKVKIVAFATRILPTRLLLKITHDIEKSKTD